jgi:hypothetical protein
MWVLNQPRCPGPGDTCQYDVIRPLAVIGEDTLLAVNFNENVGQCAFRLNFVPKNTTDDTIKANYIDWDPIVTNKDGGV